jgi:hypothetical protein
MQPEHYVRLYKCTGWTLFLFEGCGQNTMYACTNVLAGLSSLLKDAARTLSMPVQMYQPDSLPFEGCGWITFYTRMNVPAGPSSLLKNMARTLSTPITMYWLVSLPF